MRKALILILVVLVVFAIVGDFVLEAAAERAVGAELTSTLELEERPDVEIDASPFLLAFIKGRLDAITINSTDVEAGVLNLAEVTLDLQDVEFEPGEVVSGELDRITIDGGEGEGTLTQADLNDALSEEGAPVKARLTDGVVSLRTKAGSVEGGLAIEDGVLVVSGPGGISVGFSLPSLGGRVTFDDLEIAEGEAVLTLGVSAGELRAPA